MTCPRCGEQNPEGARFCAACAAPLLAPARTRRTVTVLFCDVTGSTPLTGGRDPETMRRIMSRYFEATSAVLRRHGGTVEKYIGDAVMAVFGIPRVHEDDALRALRAAHELQGAIEELNEELERSWGVGIEVRVGVNSGEVVAGDPSAGQAFATGEAVILAQRLESAAPPGEVLVGDATRELVGEAARLEPVGPLTLKGMAEPVPAWRLLGVLEDAVPIERRLDAPLVDREEELARLRDIFEQAVRARECQVCTILGTAGVGKSRLATELLQEVGGRATALSGRCLAYGEGITFWPLAQIVREAGGEEALAAALAEREDAGLIIDRLRAVVGRAPATSASEEIFWAVRRFFETLASRRPLVVCLEDIHWAEPTFLDLIEYLAGWSRDAPILLLCLARPELLDDQPTWLAGQANATALRLGPLEEADAHELLDELSGEAALSAETRGRIAEAADGNPLYIEQMAAMALEGANGNGALRVPPTIQTLLAARLDRLEPLERSAIERAAVIGKEFWRGPVVALSPEHERSDVGATLFRLVRKELVRPSTSVFLDDDAFRFRHVLIRDAAYAGIPKEQRAELHERLAGWLEANAEDAVPEVDEIIGYHLEQAHRYVVELGEAGDRVRALAAAGAHRLADAGRRALARDDARAAVSLLTRATVLVRDDDRARVEIAPDLGAALMEAGRLAQADGVLASAIGTTSALGEEAVEGHARLLHLELQLLTASEPKTGEIKREAERILPLLAARRDELALARSWYVLAQAHWTELQASASAAALERALEHARGVESGHVRTRALTFLTTTLVHGPTPVSEALRRCERLSHVDNESRTVESAVLRARARLLAMLGNFDEARALMAHGRSIIAELGLAVDHAGSAEGAAFIELLAGDPAAAEALLAPACAKLEEIGDRGYLSTLTAYLAESLYLQGRYEDARRFAETSERAAAPDDLGSHVVGRLVRARMLARVGETEAAEQFAREAVALADRTDFLNLRADALFRLAEVIRTKDRAAEAADVARQALRLYEQKGNVASAAHLREQFPL